MTPLSDIAQVLERLHIEVHEETNGELWALCPGHVKMIGTEQGHPTWSINEESGLHSCFSCGYQGNLVMLVADVLDMTTEWGTPAYERAKRWLENLIEVDFSTLRAKTEALSSYVSLPQVIPITEARLSAFSENYPVDEMKRRRLRRRPLHMLGVRWDDKISAWILPIRDPDTAELRG